MQNQRIVIVAEKIVTKNGRMYKILDVQATPRKKLPDQYLEGYPYVVPEHGGVNICKSNAFEYLQPGQTITEAALEARIAECKEAGDRLHKIRQKIKESLKNWKGIRTEAI